MEVADLERIVADAVRKETAALQEEVKVMKSEQKKLREVVGNLEKENKKLLEQLTLLDRNLDQAEQYNRKTSLILGGDFPEYKEGETPGETREAAMAVIKDKLKVELKGGIAACHRLRNKKRVIVKFQDLDDKEAVYQAKFEQKGEWKEKVTVHENLTEKRAKMVALLEEMRKRKEIANYYTKNGNIMARDDTDKRYSLIQPWLTVEEIKNITHLAPLRQTQTNTQFLRSQTLKGIPQGSVTRRAADLEEFVVGPTRQTRQSKKADVK